MVSEAVTAVAPPGTLRGNLCLYVGRNVVHAADVPEEAELDIRLWFPSPSSMKDKDTPQEAAGDFKS
jgi:nucleoside-diphosphate kinase